MTSPLIYINRASIPRSVLISRRWRTSIVSLLLAAICGTALLGSGQFRSWLLRTVFADATAQTLPFTQNWSNTALITTNDNWSGVPGIEGFLGQDITTSTGVDPQTLLTTSAVANDLDVIANQVNPNTVTNGGVAEFDVIANPTIALNGSGTADAPYVLIHLNTTGQQSINVAYNLRDLDGSVDNAIQRVALQFRIGNSGNFTNMPAGFVADATTGPSLATLVTPVNVTLPAAADNQPLVQVRMISSNAVGNDEWVGVDDINITGTPIGPTPNLSIDDVSVVEGNAGTVIANFTVSLTSPAGPGGVTFDIATQDNSATTADNDYVGKSLTGQSIPETFSSYMFSVTVNGDTNVEPNEQYFVNVSTITGATAGDVQGVGAISNDDFAATPIHTIQGSSHLSPFVGNAVTTSGIVTAKRSNGFYLQDPVPDADDRTSEGIFVFTSSAPTVNVGDAIFVTGTVQEFRPGGAGSTNLTTTEITSPIITLTSSGNALPAPTVIGAGGQVPPSMVIEDDATGSVETSGVFDPATDGIDFYESLEAMRVQVNNAVVVGPNVVGGEIPVLSDDGANASVRTTRGGVVVRSDDFNPERIFLDDQIASTPTAVVGDHFTAPIVGVMDYSFGNFKLEVTTSPIVVSGGLSQEVTTLPTANQLAVATFNVENLDPTDLPAKFSSLAGVIVNNLKSPDLIALEEIQDNTGATNNGVVDATQTYNLLIAAILSAGGPSYQFRQINPVNNQDGGEPGGNIRVGFLFRTDRGLAFIDRPGGTSTAATTVASGIAGPELSFSPGRIDPTNAAFTSSRKPLAGEFTFNCHKLFVIANHFVSKGGDEPLFGRFQPPTLSSEIQRVQQAQVVNDFVDSILALDPNANIVTLGDLNDFEFSNPLTTLKGGVLNDLIESLPQNERYTYVFEGNSQALDHILVSDSLFNAVPVFDYDVVHVNSEFVVRTSDHDPQVVRLTLADTIAPMVICPGDITVGNDPGLCSAVVNYTIPTATDNCTDATVVCEPSPGSVFPKGTTTVNCTASDAGGTSSSCSFTITVNDTEAPVISGASVSPATLSPPNHKMVNVTVSYSSSDNCGATNCSLSVTSNEPVDGTGDGDTSPDWIVVDEHHVKLRAERSGGGSNRVYTITITCTDGAGNSSSQSRTVTVSHN